MQIRRNLLLIALVLSALTLPLCAQSYRSETEYLAKLLNWHDGSVVAEIGAGAGQMTAGAAEIVGSTGHVYTTEVSERKLEHLKELAAESKFHNITVIEGSQAGTNLPHECCGSIYMRRVYHHFTEPEEMDASLFQSLKPGGLLAVIDFTPRAWMPPPAGVPANRGGHGMPKKILIQELTHAGFQVVNGPMDWPGNNYCLVFKKPGR